MQQQFAKEIYRRLVSLRYDNLVSISKEPRWCTLSRGLKRGADLIHNTDIYLTLLILLCLCSNYTPSGISPGKIPSHPSHFAVLIADDLRVRTRVNVPLKGSESDGTAGGRWGGEGRGAEGWWGRGMFCPSGLGQPRRRAGSEALDLSTSVIADAA